MCGIAGIVSLSGRPLSADALGRMVDAIAHRGPDGAGIALFGESRSSFADPAFHHLAPSLPVRGGAEWKTATNAIAGLGHRRLAILDLSRAGHQPMSTPDGRWWITFNGEIYDFRDLRANLEKQGASFRSRTDTEVVLEMWRRSGPDCLRQLNGMFALAIWDAEKRELFLARDRFGVKPVYWTVAGGELLFASEPKAILASGRVRAEIDVAALGEYFTFQNVFGTETLFRGISILEPGSLLHVRDQKVERRRWAPPPPPVDPSLADDPKLNERVSEAFAAAVTRQLVSDVEVGSYLSGGMDSGSIVAVAGRSIPRLLTFTGGFDLTNVDGLEQGFDERKLAEKLSWLLQTEHYDVVLHAGDMPAAMPRLTKHVDDPRVGMCHQNWYVAKLASKFVKVCLAGAGGDELFAGYPWRYRMAFESEDEAAFDRATLRQWHRLLAPEEMPSLFSKEIGYDAQRVESSFRAVMADAPANDAALSRADNLLQRALHFEYRTFLHGFLVIEDRVSMAHGLETRVPFLDNHLADLAWRIPPRMKLAADGSDGKLVLRSAMEKFLPREFTRQKKQGFSPPDENWYRGPSMEYLKTILLDSRTTSRPWFDPAFVRARLDEHFAGKRNHRLLIWSLLSFEWLQRHYLDGAT